METNPSPHVAAVYRVLVLMLVLSGLDQTVLSTALPGIVDSMHGAALAPWVFSAYLLASTAVIPLYGKLADRWGVRSTLLVATGLFTLGSLACALADTMPLLVAARGLQGLGGGGLMTLTMLAAATLYPPEQRGRRMGMLGAAYGLSTLIGPLAGGLMLQWLSWRWAFIVNVPCAALAWLVLRGTRFGTAAAVKHPLDGAGAVLLGLGLVAALLATRGELAPGGPWAMGALALVALAAWVVVERRAADPLLPLSLFGRRGFGVVAGLSALSGVNLFAAVVFVPLYLQQGLGFTPLHSALCTFGLMLGLTVAAQVSGRKVRAGWSVRAVGTASALSMVAGYALLAAVLVQAQDAAWALGAALVPVGLGLGLLFPLVTLIGQRSAPPQQMGVATSTPVMLRSLGGAMGVALLGEQLARHMAQAAPTISSKAQATTALAGGVGLACAACVGVSLLMLWLARALPADHEVPAPVAQPAA